MRGLTSRNLVFHTLPIKGFATIDGQDANMVDVPYIQRIVHDTFYPQPVPQSAAPAAPAAAPISKAAAGRTTVAVFNGGPHDRPGRAGLGRTGQAGLPGGHGGQHPAPAAATAVLYGAGASASAAAIAKMFGVTAVPDTGVAAGNVQVLLGANAVFPSALAAGASASPSSIIPTTGPQGGAVIAPKDGIPCVN